MKRGQRNMGLLNISDQANQSTVQTALDDVQALQGLSGVLLAQLEVQILNLQRTQCCF
jgi:hypothetical protein